MLKVTIFKDIDKAQALWQRHWPQHCLFDLWPVRVCFQDQFNHTPHFLVASQGDKFRGLLALSRMDEVNCFGHFPGELWQGKTWLEQNKIIAADSRVARTLLEHMPWETNIRYLNPSDHLHTETEVAVDEIGYLFFPQQFGYRFDSYLQSFAGKTRKKLRSELERLKNRGVTYRFNHWPDIDAMFRLNLARYQGRSYFDDNRFLRAFENLASWLRVNNLLRIVTVLVGGKVAAVDMGAIWNATYTVMAGGTHGDFPGIAKLINLHHCEWACTQRIQLVDFMCGEFNWKDRFHLSTRPLYCIQKTRKMASWSQETAYNGREICAA
jgi:hypothetical protein